MAVLLDTNIVFHLIEGELAVVDRLTKLISRPCLSVVTMVEIAGGLSRAGAGPNLRARTEALVSTLTVLDFGREEVACYDRIVMQRGYARNQVLDRMISAQAIVADATLVTRNIADFRDIPDLKLEAW
jgi:tRNA(fMet)-specific endonuclease VapC